MSCTPASGALAALGTTAVTCTATDGANNTANCSSAVQVVDTQKPTITLNAGPSVLECGAAYREPGAAASDTCDANVPVSITGGVNSTTVGNYTITYNAQDDNGNAAVQQTCVVTVQDTTAPAITCPANIAVDPESPNRTVVTFVATATDICDATPDVVCPDSGDTFDVGTGTVVTCTATDASNNQTPCSFTVKVFSANEVVANLQADAVALGDSGTITDGQENSLLASLKNILKKVQNGPTSAACGQLQGFVSKLNGWVADGTLIAVEAQPLLTSATKLRATLNCK